VHALLQRNLRQCSRQVKTAYFTYVRPILEYVSIVWSSDTKANIYKLEISQHKAAWLFNNYSRYSSVMSMLHQLNWDSLEQRHTKATSTMFYKIINNIVSVNFSEYLQWSKTRTRGHQLKFSTILTRTSTLYHSFLPRAIHLWNSLPDNIVIAFNLGNFCTELDMHLHSIWVSCIM